MPYTAEHKARTRERIIHAARQLFNRHGFEAVSIDQIVTLCVGGMVLARTTNDPQLGKSLRANARRQALALLEGPA